MIRLLIFFIVVILLSLGFAWFADRPGNILVEWQGYEIETSLFTALVLVGLVIAVTLALWSLMRNLISSPTAISDFFRRRKRDRGMEAITNGMIAIGAGDRERAQRYALQARRALPNDPMTDLLRAQTAQISGDNATSRRIYEAMLSSPETELLGLRGLFLEAKKENEYEPARQYAERALGLNPELEWSANALFDLQCRSGNWEAAAKTLQIARKNGHIDKKAAARKQAILLTAQASEREDEDMNEALANALQAHKLAPDLVPAADIAGRILASTGNTAKAAKVIRETWKMSPHPDLARTYAYARPGDSPADRLKRVNQLAELTPNNIEAPIAIADAALDAHDWLAARAALEPLLEKRLTARICLAMARIEGGQYGDKGRVREWLARAVHAPRDPTWTADGYISEKWLPVSPITGLIDSFDWQIPVDSIEEKDSNRLLEQLNVLAAEALIEAKPQDDAPKDIHGDVKESIKDVQNSTEAAPQSDAPITVEATTLEPDEIVYPAKEVDKTKPATKTKADTAADEKASAVAAAVATAAAASLIDEDADQPDKKADDKPIILNDKSKIETAEVSPVTADAAPPRKTRKPKKEETKKADSKKSSVPKPQKDAQKPVSELPGSLRSLPPPSPEIAPTSEPRIFVSPRAPDDPGPDRVD